MRTPRSDRRLYVVATVHLDTQWRWTVQDTIRDFLPATLTRNFELLERHPFFVVSFEGAFRYQLIKEYHPLRFARLRQWVAAGRWRLAGSMLDAPDVNIVSPESLIRHVLYGNGIFQQEFGLRSSDLFLPDCFGFGFALPAVAAHCGLRGFSSQKFGRWMAPAAIPFEIGVWEGPDGSQIVAALRPEGYGEGLREDLSEAARYRERIDRLGESSGVFIGLKYVGIGDRGGGLDDSSVAWLGRSLAGRGPLQVILSGSDQLFRELRAEEVAALPRHRGELLLPTHGTGCLTSQATLKRWNRRNELLADAAERAAVIADWLGALPYPGSRIREAWIRFLWHQMHDDLTGTSIPAAYRFTRNDQLLSLHQFGAVLTQSVGAVAACMDTRCGGHPVVVFNPLSIEREDVVEIALAERHGESHLLRVLAPDGIEVPSQVAPTDGGGRRVLFLARLPPLGFQVYDLRCGESWSGQSCVRATPSGLENHRYLVEIDHQGDISRILDKATGRELLAAPIRLELLRDRSARWPAWEVLYRDLQEEAPERVGGQPQVRVVENGPVRAAVEIERSARRSRFRQRVQLAAGEAGNRLEVTHLVDWRTRGRLLKAAFRFGVANPQATYDLGLGVIDRGNNRRESYEVPAQQWAALRDPDGRGGVSVLNDSKYGWDKPDDRTLRLSLLRSPRVRRRFRHQARQDHGRHRFTFAVYGHADGWRPGDTCWQASRMNQPPLAFFTTCHPGHLERSFSFIRQAPSQAAIRALKLSEQSESRILVRLHELDGRTAEASELGFVGPLVRAHETDGMEDLGSAIPGVERSLRVRLRPFEVRSFALELARPRHPAGRIRCQPLELPFDAVTTRQQGVPDRQGLDGRGRSIPAELFPETLVQGGVRFVLGPGRRGDASAVACRGQILSVAAPELRRLHLLAASVRGRASGVIRLGESAVEIEIEPCFGFLDTGPTAAVQPGGGRSGSRSIRLDDHHEVAWVATHLHGSGGEDEPYAYGHLYRYRLCLPQGCTAIRLPDNAAIHLFAATLSDERISDTTSAWPLYD